jgi:FKBP-type peptidyl-prolyl cis-trans isomerase 2
MPRRRRKGKEPRLTIWVLVLIMFFGTLAGAFLFAFPRTEEPPEAVEFSPPPSQERESGTERVLLRHNPANVTLHGVGGFQRITYDDRYIYIDSNHPLSNQTLILEIRVLNISRGNTSISLPAEEGDVVTLEYTGRLEDGRIFETTSRALAEDPTIPKVDWFLPRETYPPLRLTLGAGRAIAGLENALYGMRPNETKTVVVPPEEAYGEHLAALVQKLPIVQAIPKVSTIPRYFALSPDEFKERYPGVNATVGRILPFEGEEFNVSIYNITEDRLVLERLVEKGQVLKFSVLPWNVTILSVFGNSISYENNVVPGQVVHFPNYPWNTTILPR